MIISKKEQNDFKNAKSCHICNKEYNTDDVPVRNHCHVTRKYRGSAHTDCNLSYRLTNKIYVILKADVLILADVFENFRKTGKEYYNLESAYYFSCSGFAWDAMLKMTDINLELITDTDMYQMVETGLRGGVSYIANRYSKPNNKYLSDNDKKKIVYIKKELDILLNVIWNI